MPCAKRTILLEYVLWYSCRYFGFCVSFLYSINLLVSSLSTVLRFFSGKLFYANCLGASFHGAVLGCASIASWVLDFIGTFLLRVLCAGISSVSFFIMCWAASCEERRGVDGCSTLEGGSTLGCIAFRGIWGVGMRLNR